MDIVQRAFDHDGDSLFGPQWKGHFDFTLLFDHYIFTILPAAVLIILSPFYLFRYFKSPAYIAGSGLLWAKLATAASLLALDAATLVVWAALPAYRSDVSLAAATISCVCSLCIVALVSLGHRHSWQSQNLVSLYVAVSLLLSITKTRSYFSRPGLGVVAALSVAISCLKLLLLLLEEVPKRHQIRDTTIQETLSKEEASGFWNRSFFVWLNSTFFLGFWNVLEVKHLGKLGHEFSSNLLNTKFEPIWKQYKTSKYPLITASFVTLFWPFTAVVLPRLLYTGFTFVQPFLIRRIIIFLGEENPSIDVRNGLIIATVLTYLGKAVSKAAYNHMNYRLVTRLRGVLTAQIFKKTLHIHYSEAKKFSAATLMSTDIEGLCTNLPKFHEIWANLLELVLGFYFLWTMVGPAAVLVFIPTSMGFLATVFLGKQITPAQASWNKEIEKRISVTSSVLGQIMTIRMMGLGPAISGMVQALREREISHSKKFRVLNLILQLAVVICSDLTPISVITVALFWTSFTKGLEAETIYTTLGFVVLTTWPLTRIMYSYSSLSSMLACFHRIQAYAFLDEPSDRRVTIGDLVLQCRGDIEKDDSDIAVTPNARHAFKFQLPQPPLVFSDVSLAPVAGGNILLKNISLSINRSELVAIVGRVGVGKSTLLRAIIGEATVISGDIYVEQKHIAYCDQSPWLRNITLRDNITGGKAYDRDLYETVISACLLEADFSSLAAHDGTLAGNGGTNLSGGQRQRVALARAIYARTTLIVLDNVFSSLDKNTANAIFNRLFSSEGLLRRFGCTVVMTTNNVDYANSADRIFAIDSHGMVIPMAPSRDASAIAEFALDESFPLGSQESCVENESTAIVMDSVAPVESLERQRGDVKLYLYYLSSTTKMAWATSIISLMFATLLERLPDIFIRIWLHVAPQNKAFLAIYISLGLAQVIGNCISLGIYYIKIIPETSRNLHLNLLDTVMSSTLSFVSSTKLAPILNLFSQDMNLVSQDLPYAFYFFLYVLFLCFIDIGVISSGATYVAITIPFIFAFLYLIQYYYLRTSRQLRHLDLESKTPLYAQFTELATGLMHIRSFSWAPTYSQENLKALDQSQIPFYYRFCIQRWLGLVLDLSVLGIATILVSVALCVRDTTSQGAIGLAMLNLINFGTVIALVIEDWTSLETSLGAIARIRSFNEKTPTEARHSKTLPPGCLKDGAIQLIDMTSTYDSPTQHAPQIALDRVNLDIKPGQKIAITGRTGGGKSSLLLTLLGFMEYSGTIKFDGVDLTELPLEELRTLITTIPQDLVELPGSVRDNIFPRNVPMKPMDNIRNMVLEDVLRQVYLFDHIQSRGGLDAPFADMGFSHGQRQLLSVARAILHKIDHESRIVFIDEVTSALDCETAEEIQELMDSAFADCTVLYITHLHNIAEGDIVVNIRDGRIISVTEHT